MEVESREPAHGSDAAHIWASALGALAGTEPWALDFFAHLDRVREYCTLHAIPFEEKSSGHLVGSRPIQPELTRDSSNASPARRLARVPARCWLRATPP